MPLYIAEIEPQQLHLLMVLICFYHQAVDGPYGLPTLPGFTGTVGPTGS